MVYVNKMDMMGADFFNVLKMIHDRLKCNAVPIQLPIGSEDTFSGIIDLVEMKADIFYDELGKDMREEAIPADMDGPGKAVPRPYAGAVSDEDDEIMTMYLEGEEIPEQMIRAALRKATIDKIVPVTCGSSYKNKGVQELLDAIVEYMPPPRTNPPCTASTRRPTRRKPRASDDEPVLRSGLQDHDGPLCRQSGVLPRVFRHARGRQDRAQRQQRASASVWAESCSCTPTTEKT